MDYFFWDSQNGFRIGLFPTTPLSTGMIQPFVLVDLRKPGTWKLTACSQEVLLFRDLDEHFTFAVFNYEDWWTVYVPRPKSLDEELGIGSYGFIVDPVDREVFRVICFLPDLRVRSFDSISEKWSDILQGGLDKSADHSFKDVADEVEETSVMANGGLLYWLSSIRDRRFVRSYDPKNLMFSLIKLPEVDDYDHSRLCESEGQLWYVGVGWWWIRLWNLKEATSLSSSSSLEPVWRFQLHHEVPLTAVGGGTLKLRPPDIHARLAGVTEANMRGTWALGLDCKDHHRVFLFVLPNDLYSFNFKTGQLVHIINLPPHWLPMSTRLFPYLEDPVVPSPKGDVDKDDLQFH